MANCYNFLMDRESLLRKLNGKKIPLEKGLREYTKRLAEAEGAMQSWSSRLRQDIEAERDGVIRQLQEMTEQIDEVTHLESVNTLKVAEGSLVTLDFGNNEIETYLLLKSPGDPELKILSTSSPIGRELIGKTNGEEIEINTENGLIKIKILKIEGF